MRYDFIVPGKIKEKYLKDGVDDFSKRLKRFCKIQWIIIKENKKNLHDPIRARELEAKKLLEKTSKMSYVVALAPEGKQVSSEKLASTVSGWEKNGITNIAFIIGGPLGLAPVVLEKASLTLSLSRMTFTHEMARLLLIEQLYRAYAIKHRTGYHK
jgi:23S rRNA (pseudouridine1915-N3)-methyltransferase